MNHAKSTFVARDGTRLFRQSWCPDAPAHAAVVIVHGILEHSGRHAFLAEGLAARGYAVDAIDLRGHGRSSGRRASIRRFDQYLDDVALLLAEVRRLQGGRPLFLFGHSMGAQIALLLAIERRPELAGLVASSPVLQPGSGLFPWLRQLAWLVGEVFPNLRLVRMGCRNISRDPAVVEAFRRDPLVYHDRFEARIAAEALRAGRRIRRAAERVRVPLLVVHGTGDEVAALEGSEELVRRAGTDDATLEVYPGLLHECLSEPERDQVRDDILAWLDARSHPRVLRD